MLELVYPIAAYAPGHYSNICVACDAEFTGDKRAMTCEPCAIEMVEMGAEAYARTMHANQKYGDDQLPYVDAHVVKVVAILDDFTFNVLYRCAGWLHDVIEDTPASRHDVERHCGKFVADLVWACSGFGDNRKARNECIYQKIAEFPAAAIVKVADRIANVEASSPTGTHRQMYLKERETFHARVAHLAPPEMVERLEAAYLRTEGASH